MWRVMLGVTVGGRLTVHDWHSISRSVVLCRLVVVREVFCYALVRCRVACLRWILSVSVHCYSLNWF